MDLAESIQQLQDRVRVHRDSLKGSEAIKTSLVLPFIRALGYDVFDPIEITPAFRSGETGRADYAINADGHPAVLIAVSSSPADLGSERNRLLADCFAGSGARCAVLTDGVVYRFHTDSDQAGTLDRHPLLVIDLATTSTVDLTVLSRFDKGVYDIDAIIAEAHARRYPEAVVEAIAAELADPTQSYSEAILRRLEGEGITPRGDTGTLMTAIGGRIARAIQRGDIKVDRDEPETVAVENDDNRAMTPEETEAFHIVRAICARIVDPTRVVSRPNKSYCAILLDDNNRKSIARLHFSSLSTRYLGTFVDKDETKTAIPGPVGIYAHEQLIVDRIAEMDPAISVQAD